MEWNRVWAIGRDSYIRFYPNPGIGLCVGRYRLALSWVGGLEWFRSHPTAIWVRRGCIGDRRKR